MESTAQSLQWYAFRMSVRTPHEAQAIARREGFETYYALRKQLKDASYDTPTDEAFQDKPLLPSVIFVKCTEAFALKMQDSKKMWPYRMPGEKSLCPITQRDIDVFRTAVESGCHNLEVIDENLAMGDKVRVLDGIFNYKIPCSGVISRPAASTSCRSFFITSAGIHLRSTLTVRTRLRLRTMSIGA